jgi:general L-amino acid transport system permease protein
LATTVEKRPQKTPIYRNVTFLKWAAQLLALAIALAVIWVLGRTVAQNIQDRGITFGWGWLEDPPGITIREGIDTNPATGARALLVGIVNMLRVTATGIIAATILGTIIGVARLSRNWIASRSSARSPRTTWGRNGSSLPPKGSGSRGSRRRTASGSG